MMLTRLADESPQPEALHHALDEAILDGVAEGTVNPLLRFWYRQTPAVPLGRFQAYADEVAVEYVETHDIPVIRRITGGGAMYVAPGDVITFSIYLPRSAVPSNVEESYRELNKPIIEALERVGVTASHEPLNDIAHPDGKLGGAAQLRKRNAVLHHTTMSYSLDIEEMLRVLRIGEEKVSDKAVKSAEKRVALISDYTDADRATIIEAIAEAVGAHFGSIEPGSLDPEITDRARALAETKFSTDGWNKRL